MPVIHLPVRQPRALEPIHRTPPRVGIYVAAARARATGPQAHLSPYVADEQRAVARQVRTALLRFSGIVATLALVVHVARAGGLSL